MKELQPFLDLLQPARVELDRLAIRAQPPRQLTGLFNQGLRFDAQARLAAVDALQSGGGMRRLTQKLGCGRPVLQVRGERRGRLLLPRSS